MREAAGPRRGRTAGQYSPAGSVDVYDACLDLIGKLSRNDVPAFLEALSRQLVHDIPSLPDEALASVMRRLCRHLEERGPVGPAARHILMDCVHETVGRHDPELTPLLARITELLARQQDSPLTALLGLARAARSSSAWVWCGMPQGTSAREHLDDLLDALDVPQAGARHPDALVALLRAAADLGLCDWLAARAPEVLRALPPSAFGLLRPCDLPPLREALPPGAYADEFMEVERAWR
ncbi:hypothetical protein [Streptomyces sp. NPDC048710]|uniref:hypothetical protein n=1 Tax=Streptomyces sp. NPDC048710 TaxID=3365586 RepID=UPI0037215F8B